MEFFHEKSTFAKENPVYDAIPLIVIDKMGKKYVTDKTEVLKYNVSSPFLMKFRLLLFWILWAALIMTIIISLLTYFCLTPRMCRNCDILNTSSQKMQWKHNGT